MKKFALLSVITLTVTGTSFAEVDTCAGRTDVKTCGQAGAAYAVLKDEFILAPKNFSVIIPADALIPDTVCEKTDFNVYRINPDKTSAELTTPENPDSIIRITFS